MMGKTRVVCSSHSCLSVSADFTESRSLEPPFRGDRLYPSVDDAPFGEKVTGENQELHQLRLRPLLTALRMLPIAVLVSHSLRLYGVEGDADEEVGKRKVFLPFRQFGGRSPRLNASVNENTTDGTLTDIRIGGNTLDVLLRSYDYPVQTRRSRV